MVPISIYMSSHIHNYSHEHQSAMGYLCSFLKYTVYVLRLSGEGGGVLYDQ